MRKIAAHPHSGWFNIACISVSLLRNSSALNRVYPAHNKRFPCLRRIKTNACAESMRKE